MLHFRTVGGIWDQQKVIVTLEVDDQVIDHSPGGVVAKKSVLSLARLDLPQVIGQRGIEEFIGLLATNHQFAQMPDVEDAD